MAFPPRVRDEGVVASPGQRGVREGCRGTRLPQDPALDLADELGEWLAGGRVGVEPEYEPYLAALRNPALRPVAAEWCQELSDALAERIGPVTARALVALMDGISLQVLLTGGVHDAGYAREMPERLTP